MRFIHGSDIQWLRSTTLRTSSCSRYSKKESRCLETIWLCYYTTLLQRQSCLLMAKNLWQMSMWFRPEVHIMLVGSNNTSWRQEERAMITKMLAQTTNIRLEEVMHNQERGRPMKRGYTPHSFYRTMPCSTEIKTLAFCIKPLGMQNRILRGAPGTRTQRTLNSKSNTI